MAADGTETKRPIRLSVVMPCYNERGTIDQIIERVAATPYDKEIIVVDDGSKDGTRERLKELEPKYGLKLIFHEKNQGKGGALRTGFAQTTGEIVLIQDADLEYDPSDYPKLLRPILEGKADVVFGSRFLGGSYARVHLYWHYLGNRALTTLSNMFTNLNLSDMETCYKVFRSDVAKRLDIRSRTFAVEPEITAKVAKMRVRVYEVPISYAGRDYSEGKKIGPKDALIAFWAIVRWRFFG